MQANKKKKQGPKKATKPQAKKPLKKPVPKAEKKGPERLESLVQSGVHLLTDTGTVLVNPTRYPPIRLQDELREKTCVFKRTEVREVEFHGKWNAGTGKTDAYNPGDAGYTEVLALPCIEDTVLVPTGVQIDFNELNFGLTPFLVESRRYLHEAHYIKHPLRMQGYDFAVVPRADSAGRHVYEVGFAGDAGDLLSWRFTPRTTNSMSVGGEAQAVVQADIGAGWVTILTMNLNGLTQSGTYALGVNTITRFSVHISPLSSNGETDYDFSVNCPFASASGVVVIAPLRGACCYNIVGSTYNDLDKASKERCTAQSLMLSYRGSSLANGGQLGGIRMPVGECLENAESGDFYSYIVERPYDKHREKLQDGIYIWRLPSCIQELRTTPYRSHRMNNLDFDSVLIAAAIRVDPLQALEMEVTTCFEVVSTSTRYPMQVSGYNPNFWQMIHLMDHLPAVTCNPWHTFLKNVWKSLKEKATDPKTWTDSAQWIFRNWN